MPRSASSPKSPQTSSLTPPTGNSTPGSASEATRRRITGEKRSATPTKKETVSAAAGSPLVTTPSDASSSLIDTANFPTNLAKAATILSVGAIQGMLLGLAGMFSPYTFRSQMYFDTFILMKIFISGVASSMITQSLVFDSLYPEKWNIVRSYRRVSLGFSRVIIGCLLIGAGMAICGSGPTMIGVQLGMGMGSALYIFAGFLAGAAIFQAMEGTVFHFPTVCWKGDEEKTVVEDYFNEFITVNRDGQLTAAAIAAEKKMKNISLSADGKKKRPFLRYRDVALPVGVFMMLMSLGLEFVFPHANDLKKIGLGPLVDGSSPLTYVFPTIAGGFIGINQLSTRFIMSDGQGGSRSLVNIVATLTNGAIGQRFKIDSFAKSWQFLHVYVATFIGGLIALRLMNGYFVSNSGGGGIGEALTKNFASSSSSSSTFTSFSDVTSAIGFAPVTSFMGAVIVGFGGRYAGGCTCGHGVSGSSELCVQSLAGAAAIFGGGIATAVLLGLRAPQF